MIGCLSALPHDGADWGERLRVAISVGCRNGELCGTLHDFLEMHLIFFYVGIGMNEAD